VRYEAEEWEVAALGAGAVVVACPTLLEPLVSDEAEAGIGELAVF
jgi:hypothetical protein